MQKPFATSGAAHSHSTPNDVYVLKHKVSGKYWTETGTWALRQIHAAKLRRDAQDRFFLGDELVAILSTDVVVKLRKRAPSAVAKSVEVRLKREVEILRRHIRLVRGKANSANSQVPNKFDNWLEHDFDAMDRELLAGGFSIQ